MKKKLIILSLIIATILSVDANAQLTNVKIIDSFEHAYVFREQGFLNGWLKIKVGGISHPRISGQGNRVVFYDSEFFRFNAIEVERVLTMSDRNLKTNIKPLDKGLSTVLSLKPVTYNIKNEIESKSTVAPKTDFGFIAQDVKEILPDAVHESETGNLLINYEVFTPLLVQAISELQMQIDELRLQLETKSDITTNVSDIVNTSVSLSQNSPNPFNNSTSISYTIPDGASKADIVIYSLQGSIVKNYNIPDKNGMLNIQAGELGAGIYLYSLVIDGKVVTTKRMLVTK